MREITNLLKDNDKTIDDIKIIIKHMKGTDRMKVDGG
jgi:hypothetical protein